MKYFGTDGIRGVANSELTSEIAFRVGRYLGKSSEHKVRIAIGNDSRVSADMLESSLIAGITSAGGDVVRIGVIPTPGVSYLVKQLGCDFGVIVSASHNPAHDNGIKVIDNNGIKISDNIQLEIEEYIDGNDNSSFPTAGRIGKIIDGSPSVDNYIEYISNCCTESLKKLHIIVDCANGASSFVAKKLFDQFKCRVEFINANPNGININDNCGSTSLGSLIEKVLSSKADLGIALDGDADRIMLVDSDGKVVDGDLIIYILANSLKEKGLLKNSKVALTSMSNLAVINALRKNMNTEVVITDVGDKYVHQAIISHDLNLGGEASGHIIYRPYSEGGDGLLIGLLVLEYLYKLDVKLTYFTKSIIMYPSELVNVRVTDKEYVLTHSSVVDEITRVKNILGDEGRVLVRASGTEQLLRVLVECSSADDAKKYSKFIANAMNELNKEEV